MGYNRWPTTLRITEDDMKDKPEFSRKRIEETAKAADIISRARAASPISGTAGRDVLRRPVDGMDERFGFPADSDYLR